MKFKSAILTQVSGSIGGATYSHNRGGLYIRARTIPVNPSTPGQVAVRAYFASMVAIWANTLTDAQRTAWTLYAANTPLTDTLGDPLVLTGQQMYVRCNTARLRAGLARVDDGPTTFGQAEVNGLVFTSMTDPTAGILAYDNTDPWAVADGGGLIVQVGRPVGPAVNFFKGPYVFAEMLPGAVIPPTSPFAFTSPTVYATDQKCFIRVRTSDVEGRLSAAQYFSTRVIWSLRNKFKFCSNNDRGAFRW